MNDTDESRPNAFVIMPFGGGFDEVYNLFLVETLGGVGFDVSRADDVRSAQNILKDIVRGIAQSDLIIADLTDSNANVYYELGLAHGLGKPVILLTQAIEDLPFDLRSYRVISYKTHFAKIAQARAELAELATEFLRGGAKFGNPASDFLGHFVELRQRPPDAAPDPGEPGVLDHMAEMEEGFERLTQSINSIGDQTGSLSEATEASTARIESLQHQPDGGSAREMRKLVMDLAAKLASYAQFLEAENRNYSIHLDQTRAAVESVVRAQDAASAEEEEQLRKFLSDIDRMLEPTREGRAAIANVAEVLRGIPSLERTYNRARERAVSELERLIENIEQTISMFSRAREIGESKLRTCHQDGG